MQHTEACTGIKDFFGVNSASEIFQEEIGQALAGIKRAINISDDILCFGSDQQDYDQNLHAIFRRLRGKGLTLNSSKCEYNKRSLEFLGHTFDNEGISPSNLKIKAIFGLPDPKNESEVRSLLGMTNFCGAEFIPNYATLTHELRQLTKKKQKKNTQWSWTERHTECLKNIEKALSKACSLACFDPNRHTEIHTDASPVGISAVLSQNGRIVQFANRALSAVEQRYSQTEREALAITWACEHFHIYIFGAPFTVFTDHQPLTSIFNNTLSQLSARIERWVLRTQPYDMTVIYRPGHDNPADYSSHHPTHLPPSDREQKNSRGIYKLHPLNLNPQNNDNWWSCNGNGKRQDTHHRHPSHPYQQMAWSRGWHKQSNIPHSACQLCRTITSTQG